MCFFEKRQRGWAIDTSFLFKWGAVITNTTLLTPPYMFSPCVHGIPKISKFNERECCSTSSSYCRTSYVSSDKRLFFYCRLSQSSLNSFCFSFSKLILIFNNLILSGRATIQVLWQSSHFHCFSLILELFWDELNHMYTAGDIPFCTLHILLWHTTHQSLYDTLKSLSSFDKKQSMIVRL